MNCPICGDAQSDFVFISKTQLQVDDKTYQFDKCQNCSCIYLKNPPTEINLSYYYGENYLPYAASKPWGKYTFMVQLWQKALDYKKYLFVKRNTTLAVQNFSLLDFGCGNPSFLNIFSNKLAGTFVGYDFNDSGWKQNQHAYNKLKLYAGNLNEIKEKFHVITLWHSLEHHFKPNELLQELRSLLHEKGRIIIEVPNFNSFFVKLQKGNWGGLHTPRHSVIYTPQSLTYLLQKNGFTVRKIQTHGTLDSFTLWWLGQSTKYEINSNLAAPFEGLFLKFMFYKILLLPFFLMEKYLSLGIMTIVCEKTAGTN